MKKPKTIKRFCKFCKKHTEQKVAESKNRGRSTAHPLSKFGTRRLLDRGERRGAGNHGKFSKPPIKSWKRVGRKTMKNLDLRYTCNVCKKSTMQKTGIRTKKMEFV